MNEKNAGKKDQEYGLNEGLLSGDICEIVRLKLETSEELDEKCVEHISKCGRCLGLFQRFEDCVTQSAHIRIIELNRAGVVDNFSRRHYVYCRRKKSAFLWAGASAFAAVTVLFTLILWFIAGFFEGGVSSRGKMIASDEEIQNRSLALYSSYSAAVNKNFDTLYEDVSFNDYSSGDSAASVFDLSDEFGQTEIYGMEANYESSFPVFESGSTGEDNDILALNIAAELDYYYTENIRKIDEYNSALY